jgi:hypothetical protein
MPNPASAPARILRRSDAQTSPVGLHLRRYFERELHVTKCWCCFSALKFIERMTRSIKRAPDIQAPPA